MKGFTFTALKKKKSRSFEIRIYSLTPHSKPLTLPHLYNWKSSNKYIYSATVQSKSLEVRRCVCVWVLGDGCREEKDKLSFQLYLY